ncbi:MAG TPA: hypothetical protein VN224_05765, partial [Xanthomonadales bacterium]|nr:hypothetical protein [Xanthomonadales bacterium]
MTAAREGGSTMTVVCRLLAVAVLVLGAHAGAGAQASAFQVAFQTFAPAAPVQVQIRTTAPTDLAVDAIPVSVTDVIAIRRHSNTVRLDELRAKPVRTVRDGVHPDLERGLLHDVRIGTLPRGYYVLAIHAGNGAGAQVVDVTSLGVLATRTPRGTVAFAVDLQTMHARTDVTVERYAPAAHTPQTQRVGGDGTASFDEDSAAVAAGPALFVARGADGSAAVA